MSLMIELTPIRQEWVDRAKCAEPDYVPRWWDHTEKWHPAAMTAMAICDRCPVKQPCLEYALAAGEKDGIWGGLLPEARERVAGRVA